MAVPSASTQWPELLWSQWHSTADTLHMYMQIVGKTRVELMPVRNHWWNVPLYLTARGLSTSAMPLAGGGVLDIEFDFVDHQLVFRRDTGQIELLKLHAQPVAAFFSAYKATLERVGVEIRIDPLPVELEQPTRFDRDTAHTHYDEDAAHRFWQVLSRAGQLLTRFSANFYGKISPVHFFWGSLDLACTRFNGKLAPARAGADHIQSEAYSHECISAGFWPGNGGYGQAAFYAYAAPVPAGLSDSVLKGLGHYDSKLGEFILDYADVRDAANPDGAVLAFFAETYSLAADAAGWDRAALDRHDSIAADAAISG